MTCHRLTLFVLPLLLLGACQPETPPPPDAPAEEASYEARGQAISAAGAVPVEAVAAEPGAYVGQAVKVEGTATQVCQKKGCWATLDAGSGRRVRVVMPRTEGGGYAFTLPQDLGRARLVVEGTLTADTLSGTMQRHFAQDAGRRADAEAAELHPAPELQITAAGVLIQR